MATSKKTKGRSKGKPKKSGTAKSATRRKKGAAKSKSASRKKIGATRKKPAKKVSIRRTSAKKAGKTATRKTVKAAAKTRQARAPARSAAATPALSPPAPPSPAEERIGVVTHYYSHLSVATLRLEAGTLRVGDTIHIHGHTTDFTQRVETLEVNHSPVTEVGPNDDFGMKVIEHAREHDVVYKVRS